MSSQSGSRGRGMASTVIRVTVDEVDADWARDEIQTRLEEVGILAEVE